MSTARGSKGVLRNVEKAVHLEAKHIEKLSVAAALTQSHDLHYMTSTK